MESKTFDEAKTFYDENKDKLLDIMMSEFKGSIDALGEDDQVSVWFDGFVICYQNGDMNGNHKGVPTFNNEGADSGLDDLKEILKTDERFQPLIASDEYWKYEYLKDFIHEFCTLFAEKNNIASYYRNDDDDDDDDDDDEYEED